MSPTRMAKIESAMRTVLAFTEAFNRQDIAGMMQLISEECRFESPSPAPDGSLFTGKEAIRRYWEGFFHQSPGIHLNVEDMFGFGARCILYWRYEWVDSAGRSAHLRGADIFEERNGAICKQFSYVKGAAD